MKKITSFTLSIVGLLAPLIATAQGTLSLSNLGEPSVGSGAVGKDQWFAQSFHTGNSSGGYALNSIQLLMDETSGSPSGFTVSIYNNNSVFPGSNLGSLSGSDPTAGGIFTYNASDITLLPSTFYFIVVTSLNPITDGAYNWRRADTFNYSSSGSWTVGPYRSISTDGAIWNRVGSVFQFAATATAVPEPSTYALMGFSLLSFSFLRGKTGKANNLREFRKK